MEKTLVVYYSHTGNNRFLAHRIAERLEGDVEEIRPVLNVHLLLLGGFGLGNKKLKRNLADYDRLILCGPVWMGRFIYPLRQFVAKHQNEIGKWLFVTCCGSSYKQKEDKYGHEMVFKKVRALFPELNIQCKALPVTMTMPEDQQENAEAMLKARLNHASFNGLFIQKFNELIESI